MKITPQPGARSLGFLLFDAARLVRRRFEQESGDMPMTAAQLRIIGQLMRNEGIGQAALADLLEIEPMTLSRHVDRMEAAGLVERRQDPSDRRARRLFTTARSRVAIEPMRARAAAIYDQALAGLSEARRDALIDALEIVITNLSTAQAADDAAPKRGNEQEST